MNDHVTAYIRNQSLDIPVDKLQKQGKSEQRRGMLFDKQINEALDDLPKRERSRKLRLWIKIGMFVEQEDSELIDEIENLIGGGY